MTREEAMAWLNKLIDDGHLVFNDDVEWKPSAADELIKLVDRERERFIIRDLKTGKPKGPPVEPGREDDL